jgi:hypothetical protein
MAIELDRMRGVAQLYSRSALLFEAKRPQS